MNFEQMGLSKPLLDALHAMNFDTPTPIQEQAIPLLLAGHDLIGQAQTGTGKTAAFGLPTLERWMHDPSFKSSGVSRTPPSHNAEQVLRPAQPQAHVSRSGALYHSRAPAPVHERPVAAPSVLILVPTRELAVQVTDSLQAMAQHTGARVVPVYGGVEMRKQLRLFRSPIDLLVGTPGRTLDHLRSGSLRLDRVRVLVLDEADRMLDMGFIHDVVKLLDATPVDRQTLLFSATLPRDVIQIAQKYQRNPQTVKVSQDTLTVENIRQLYVRATNANRFGMLLAALRELKPYLSVVFCRTKHDAKKIARLLGQNGISADALHGNLRQNARDRTMAALRAGKIDVLVATDLASRGLDVPGITHVFNYDLPDDPMTYVHRIGRTARAGASGTAVSFLPGSPYRAIDIIQNATGAKLEELALTPIEVSMPERVAPRSTDFNAHPAGYRGRAHAPNPHPGSPARSDSGPHSGRYGDSRGPRSDSRDGPRFPHSGRRADSHSGRSGDSHPGRSDDRSDHFRPGYEGRSNAERSSHRQGRSSNHPSRRGPRSGSEGSHPRGRDRY